VVKQLAVRRAVAMHKAGVSHPIILHDGSMSITSGFRHAPGRALISEGAG